MATNEFVELDKVLEILIEELPLSESLKRLIKLPRLQHLEENGTICNKNINWEDDKQLLEACRKGGSLDPRWWRKDLR